MPGPQQPTQYYVPYWYGLPQRSVGGDGQTLAQPAPGSGVYPPGGAVNPATGLPYPIGATGAPAGSSQPVQLPSFTDPPLGTQTLDVISTNVIAPASGASAAATSGAAQLASAYAFNLSGVVASSMTLTPVTVNSLVTLLTYNAISPGVFRRLGVRPFGSMAARAIRVSIQVNGTNFPGLTEVELSNFFEGNEPAAIFVPFVKQDVITVLARNIDTNSGYLVTARLNGWRYGGA